MRRKWKRNACMREVKLAYPRDSVCAFSVSLFVHSAAVVISRVKSDTCVCGRGYLQIPRFKAARSLPGVCLRGLYSCATTEAFHSNRILPALCLSSLFLSGELWSREMLVCEYGCRRGCHTWLVGQLVRGMGSCSIHVKRHGRCQFSLLQDIRKALGTISCYRILTTRCGTQRCHTSNDRHSR